MNERKIENYVQLSTGEKMNVSKIKKVLIVIGSELLFALAIAFTVAFVISKVGSSEAGDAIRTELSKQSEENTKLRGQIITFERKHSDDGKRIEELEGIEQRLEGTSNRLEELLKNRRVNDIGIEEDIEELGDILQRDRETISRIRELLQEEDPEYDSY